MSLRRTQRRLFHPIVIYQRPYGRFACEALVLDIVPIQLGTPFVGFMVLPNPLQVNRSNAHSQGLIECGGERAPRCVHAKLPGTFENGGVKLPGLPLYVQLP